MRNMARCYSPFRKDGLDLPCGKCLECKSRRISGWSFRLMKEAERSTSAFFVTLTYDPEHVPISQNNMMTLCKRDVQLFLKKLRWNLPKSKKVKYYACGEYGTKSMRPHYHLIIFNADVETVKKSWTLGEIHFGQVSEASVGYTLKYISKDKKIPQWNGDLRVPEFSLMSKKLGDNYLTPSMIRWHKADLLNRLYTNLKDGKKIAMPRYLREKIYTKHQMLRITTHLLKVDQTSWDDLSQEKKSLRMAKESRILTNKAKNNGDKRKTTL